MTATQDQPVNILLILTDQFRFDAMGCAGNPVVKAPNLDRLAASGIRFTQAYTEVPVCVAARAGLISGQYPYRLGTMDNNPATLDHQPTLAGVMRANGRATTAIGKMHFHPKRNHLGFDRMELCEGLVGHPWDDDYARAMQDKGYPVQRNMHGRGHPAVDGSGVGSTYYLPDTLPYPDEDSATTWVGDRTCAFLRANADRPFFCFSSFIKPHPPFLPSAPWNTMYPPAAVDLPVDWQAANADDPLLIAQSRFKGVFEPTEDDVRSMRSAYYGLVSQVDHQVGRILDVLDDAGLSERTMVIFSADHGELLGDHGHWGKRSFYEGSAKVPLLVSWPGHWDGDQTCDRVVGLTDILPTCVDIVGDNVPETVSGRSLVPLLNSPEAEWDVDVFGAYGGFRGLVELDDPLISTSFMVRWSTLKYIYHVNGGREQLFNLEDDPHERTNLATSDPSSCARARRALTDHLMAENLSEYVQEGSLIALPLVQGFKERVIPPMPAARLTA